MPLRVNPILLLSIIIGAILSFAIFAEALGGGTAGDAVGVGEGQMGKPFVMSTDGPNTFSCSGLIRYILRATGVDGNAPWVPEAYLDKYPSVAPGNIQPGDVVIYPDWATMYVGNGMVLNANQYLGKVTETPMGVAGIPEGIVRPPYAGQPAPGGAPNLTNAALPTNPITGTVPTVASDPPAGQGQYDPTPGLLGNIANGLAPPLGNDVPPATPGDAIPPTPVPPVAPDPPAGQGQYDPMMLGTPDLPGDTLVPPVGDVPPATPGDALQPIGDAAAVPVF